MKKDAENGGCPLLKKNERGAITIFQKATLKFNLSLTIELRDIFNIIKLDNQ